MNLYFLYLQNCIKTNMGYDALWVEKLQTTHHNYFFYKQ